MPKDPDIKKPKTTASEVSNATKSEAEAKSKTKKSGQSQPTGFKNRLEKLGIRRKPNKKAITGIAIAIISIIVATVAVFGVLIYKYKQDNKPVRIASAVVPYPVTSVNGSILWNVATYRDYLFELNSVEKFYQSQKEPLNTKDGQAKLKDIKKQIITQLQNRILIAQEARKYKIKLTQKEIDAKYAELEKNAGGADKVKQTLKQLYGWNVADFKRELSYKLLEAKLADAVSGDPKLNAAAKAQAEDIKKQISAGGDFAALAKKYSADSSAAQGGDLGYFKKGDNVAEFDTAAFALQPNQVSSVVKTQYGYHIIKVTDKKEDGSIRASHILIKSVDLNTWLQDQRKKAKIRQYFTP